MTGPKRRPLALPRALAVLAMAQLAACAGSPSTLPGRSPEARRLATVWWQILGLGAVVYVVVAGLILWAVFRRRPDRGTGAGEAAAEGDGRAGGVAGWSEHTVIVVGGVVMPAVVLLVVAFITVTSMAGLRAAASDPLRVEVVGHKWWWEITYPDDGVSTANELHVPVGRPVEVTLRSVDVIHSFWVPELGGKVDMIPGVTTTARFTAERAGTYTGACAEYCGIQHANMRFLVVAEDAASFGRWVAFQRRPAPAPSSELEARGQAAFTSQSCAGCHTIAGTTAQGRLGPDLTHFGERSTLGALLVPNTADNLSRFIVDAPSMKPGVLMPPVELSDADRRAIVAYLQGLAR